MCRGEPERYKYKVAPCFVKQHAAPPPLRAYCHVSQQRQCGRLPPGGARTRSAPSRPGTWRHLPTPAGDRHLPWPRSRKGKAAERTGLLLCGDCNLRNKSDQDNCTLWKGQDYLLISKRRRVFSGYERVTFDKKLIVVIFSVCFFLITTKKW